MIGYSRIAAEKGLPCGGCVWNVGIAQITRKMFAGIPLLKRRNVVTRKDGSPAGMDALADRAALVVRFSLLARHPGAPGQHARPVVATRLERVGTMLGLRGWTVDIDLLGVRPLIAAIDVPFRPSYQTRQRFAPTIGCPALQEKARSNSGMFTISPLTRYLPGEWGSVSALTRRFSGRSFSHAHCA